MSKCRKLTEDEKKQWEAIHNLSANEIQQAELNFVNKIMAEDISLDIPREDIPIPEEIVNRDESAFTGPRIPEVRPTLQDFKEQVAKADKVLASNPTIKAAVWIPKNLDIAKTKAQIRYVNSNKEQRKANLKIAGLSTKLFIKTWTDMTPNEVRKLILAEIPDNSIKIDLRHDIMDMEYYGEHMEEETGLPFYTSMRRIEAKSSLAEVIKDMEMKEILTNPDFAHIRNDQEELRKVGLIYNARDPSIKPAIVLDFTPTPEELMFVDAITTAYKSDEAKIRYTRVFRAPSDWEKFKAKFPDAVKDGHEDQLAIAFKLKSEGKLDDLWDYLVPLDWAVRDFYDPRAIFNPDLMPNKAGLSSVKGEGILLEREGIDYPEDRMMNNILQRLMAYKEQVNLQFLVKEEIQNFNDMWLQVNEKYEKSSRSKMTGGMRIWLDRVQHFYQHSTMVDDIVRNVWVQSMRSVFWNPVLSLRNTMQAFLLHPDRIELSKVLFNKMPADLKEQGHLYFESMVSNMGGIRTDYIHKADKVWSDRTIWKPLNFINKLAEQTTFYDWSDYFPRLHSFWASMNKANRATIKYQADGDLKAWIRNSGVEHLRLTEKNYVLENYLGQPDAKFNLAVNGLNEVSGLTMANLYVAQRITDMTNFKMKRNTRGIMEMGPSGQTLWNLTVYPRGYAQRIYFQAEKIKQVFSKNTTWEDARMGFMDIMKLMTVGALVGSMWMSVTGKRRNPWDTISTLFSWQFGGIYMGIGVSLTEMFTDMITVMSPGSAEADRNLALSTLPALISSNASTLIPFYTMAIDIMDTIKDEKSTDINGIRQLRGLLDKEFNKPGETLYTPQEPDKMNRTAWEIFKKVFLGAETPDPTVFQKVQSDIQIAQSQLGTVDDNGKYYTLVQFGGEVNTQIKKVPSSLLTKEEGFSDLTLFYVDSADSWEPYYNLITDKQKNDWRMSHVKEEAQLLFWGKYSKTIFTSGSKNGKEVQKLLSLWSSQYGIKSTMQPGADWSNKK